MQDAKDESCNVIDCRWKCGARYHSCKSAEHSIICPCYEEVDEYEWMLRGVTNLEVRFEQVHKQRKKTKVKTPTLKPLNDFFQGPGEPAIKTCQKFPDPPQIPKNLFGPRVWLDVRLETVTKLQAKPTPMYSFVCGQEFRRDEFADHCRVIHNDILGGMNNWLEHRCPLANYGCGFSHRRIYPGPDQINTLIFSPAVESFGVTLRKPRSFTDSKDNKAKTLTDLPYEILESILRYLDSFRYRFQP